MSAWFVIPRHNTNACIRLFCFPYAGGGVATYVDWAQWLHPAIELVAVQPPGRGQRLMEGAHLTMESLQADLWRAILPMLDRPFFFFGHSLGSRVAFELARKLRDEGLPLPIHFFASGSRAPHIVCRERPTHDLPDEEFIQELRNLEGTPEEVLANRELMTLLMSLLRADFRIAETYSVAPGIPFEFGISLLGGRDDAGVTEEDLQAWQTHFRRSAQIELCDGGHLFIDAAGERVVDLINRVAGRYLNFLVALPRRYSPA